MDLCEVVTECSCGRCRVVCYEGGPRFTTLCHCSICRAHNLAANGAAMAFVAVKRSACRVEIVNGEVCGDDDATDRAVCISEPQGNCWGQVPDDRSVGGATSPFAWVESSDLVRRGRCTACDSPLVFDPNTLWLVAPEVRRRRLAGGPLEVWRTARICSTGGLTRTCAGAHGTSLSR